MVLAVRDGDGEVKSMFVDSSARCGVVATGILERIEAEARSPRDGHAEA